MRRHMMRRHMHHRATTETRTNARLHIATRSAVASVYYCTRLGSVEKEQGNTKWSPLHTLQYMRMGNILNIFGILNMLTIIQKLTVLNVGSSDWAVITEKWIAAIDANSFSWHASKPDACLILLGGEGPHSEEKKGER